MSFDCLWAPWRMEFIRSNGDSKGGCFLCDCAASREDEKNLVVRRGRHALCCLNRYPYNNGHLLIAPYRHEGKIEGLTCEESDEIMRMVVESKICLDAIMTPHGYNIGANLGAVAGAGVADHFHMHIVPRWTGDTNFMTAVGSTKVIPQSLEELWRLMTARWEADKC